MIILSVLFETIARLFAILLGGWLAYTEATGTYEFYLAEQGSADYIVKAAVGVTLASVILPYFMSRAIKARQWLVTLAVLAGFTLSVAVIFTAGIHRTSSVADAAKAERSEARRKLEAARASVKDAEAALASDAMVLAGECKTGVGKECKRLAGSNKETLETTLTLRRLYADTQEPAEDNTARRLSAVTGGLLSEAQIETFRPMLVPIAVSFIAGLLITLGLDMEHSGAPRRGRRWWGWRAPSNVEPQPAPSILEPAPPSRVMEVEVVEGDPGAFLASSLKPGESVRENEVCLAYEAWCAAQGSAPIPRAKFKSAFVALCKHAGFRRARGKVFGMELADSALTRPCLSQSL